MYLHSCLTVQLSVNKRLEEEGVTGLLILGSKFKIIEMKRYLDEDGFSHMI